MREAYTGAGSYHYSTTSRLGQLDITWYTQYFVHWLSVPLQLSIIMALTAIPGVPACLEPTPEELASFATSNDGLFHPLHAIFRWAGFTW